VSTLYGDRLALALLVDAPVLVLPQADKNTTSNTKIDDARRRGSRLPLPGSLKEDAVVLLSQCVAFRTFVCLVIRRAFLESLQSSELRWGQNPLQRE
ncbi:MAG: hypothetical protein ACXVCM_24470, partial [Ktedonobacteraceae bacterium]